VTADAKREKMNAIRPDACAPAGDEARPQIRILVVDDHPAVRLGLERLLGDEPDMRCEGSAGSVQEARALVRTVAPDVVIVDYHFARGDGLKLTRELKRLPTPPRVVLYSVYADRSLAAAATVAGADGVISKAQPVGQLCDAIRAAAKGQRALLDIPADALRRETAHLDPTDELIFQLLLGGLQDREIAQTLRMPETDLEARRHLIIRTLAAADEPAQAS
jgi:DNA-binding NarL/FixJ family response regulator